VDCYKLESLPAEVRLLGKVFGEEKRAESYAAFIERHINLVRERTDRLSAADRRTVFWEQYSAYHTSSAKSEHHNLITLAGGRNIAADEPVKSPVVSAEWVLQHNPAVIIKHEIGGGYLSTEEPLRRSYTSLIERPGWHQLAAVRDGRVHVISTEIGSGPRVVIGLLYMAKWLQPELFRDVDPDAVHREFLRRFYGMDLRGIYVYPLAG